MINLVIFASGSGTNAERLMEKFEHDRRIQVCAVFTNNPKAGVIEKAESYGVPVELFDRIQFTNPSFSKRLDKHQTDFVILAGFLWKVPDYLLLAYPDTILNIHPSLLPKYGGKGMYGRQVHQAVIDAGDNKSGITIHLVNEKYDDGKILFQEQCEVTMNDTPDTLAQRIHKLEHKHFPAVVRDYVLNMR